MNMMAEGEGGMYLKGEFLRDKENSPLCLEAAVSGTDRRYKVNGKEESNLLNYLNQANVVVFFPESLRVVKEGPALRRAFIDRAIAAENPQFLGEYREFNRLLSERNRLLKERSNSDIIAVWEHRLIDSAAQVVARRCVFLDSLHTYMYSVRQRMGITRGMDIFYRAGGVRRNRENWPDLIAGNLNIKETAVSVLSEGAKQAAEDERRRGLTLWGPHLDDFDFFMDGRKVRESASQGEQRLFVISLVIATAESYRQSQKEDPIVLLDDLSSELDSGKTEAVLGYLENMGAQVFITSTQKSVYKYPQKSSTFYRVKNGKIIPQ